ncbi:MAG: hypothetical protein AAGA30_03690 [Planctomycetota bacterium]
MSHATIRERDLAAGLFDHAAIEIGRISSVVKLLKSYHNFNPTHQLTPLVGSRRPLNNNKIVN